MTEAKPKRLDFIDATRGAAMILVCFSHFCLIYGRTAGEEFKIYNLITMAAAPTFMLVSGILLGYFYSAKKNRFQCIQHQYVVRGLIMLTLGRILICLANIPRAHGFIAAYSCVYITDTIAFCSILGPVIVFKYNWLQRVCLGLLIQPVTWLVLYLFEPKSPYVALLQVIAFGQIDNQQTSWEYYSYFPLIPWFGIYLIATVLGEVIVATDDGRSRYVQFFAIGVGAIVFGVAIKLLHEYSFLDNLSAYFREVIARFTSPTQKDPPSIAYFSFYGGGGLVICSVIWKLYESNYTPLILRPLAIIGSNSLFAYIVQYYIYFLAFYLMKLDYSDMWFIYFIVSLAIFYISIIIWDAINGNNYLYLKKYARDDLNIRIGMS